ncbi:unnamed protein product [Oikopleura dioica]|uniref:Uncharacterized protein n=1 Tax=Oikopleura dioica TaxID=34765 RepID=E4Y788_OIKDI|nr:unnamed protein product [Oikopleura dioica]
MNLWVWRGRPQGEIAIRNQKSCFSHARTILALYVNYAFTNLNPLRGKTPRASNKQARAKKSQKESKTIRELDVSKAVISRQGSDLVTASFNPEEVFGIRLFEKKTCKCTSRNIFPIDEMPEIFNSTQIAQLEKNRKHDYDKWRSNNFHLTHVIENRATIMAFLI